MTVEMASEELETALSARRYMYAALQSLFGNEPSSERLQAISLPLLREASAVLGIGGADELSEAIEIASTDLEKLKGEYTRLFIGPNELPAPLWESVYVTKERILFHRRTLEVRNFYRSEGLIPQMYPSVADDHIALELDFLRSLADRIVDACMLGNRVEYGKALDASRRFLEFHLGTWVDAFSEGLARSGQGDLYPAAGRLLAAFVHADEKVLKGLLG